ncbi:MAG TPA: hypothetical protein VMV49_12465 [Candidatus Deferrimicrobium sp.]|nr:hypothetical protein [Candidatus Deferrimicrobium sp.]
MIGYHQRLVELAGWTTIYVLERGTISIGADFVKIINLRAATKFNKD